jgi:hypothetical protein
MNTLITKFVIDTTCCPNALLNVQSVDVRLFEDVVVIMPEKKKEGKNVINPAIIMKSVNLNCHFFFLIKNFFVGYLIEISFSIEM